MMNAAAGIFLEARRNRKPTAKDYVQDGLVAMWDGVENAGWGVHDPAATTWKDLTGNGYDWVGVQGGYNIGRFVDNAYHFTGQPQANQYTAQQWTINRNDICTICCCLNASANVPTWGAVMMPTAPVDKTVVYVKGIGVAFAGLTTNNCVSCNAVGRDVSAAVVFSNLSTTISNVYVDGQQGSVASADNRWGNFTGRATFGRDNGNNFQGYVYNVSLYSRALTADEIAANYAVDKARFNLP